ncbi:MAG TPA: TetR/AcrR family transcriptional regulator, partial [Actinomycetes bacterium]|nr:TetR/AcrR family transcriptional regulator [Actinomycetes bacterium]
MTSPSFRPPRQARSVATLDRIVRAAQELLAERGFDQAAVDDIVARAGSSKGSFYSRFADKEALLAYLGGECLVRAKATWAELLDPERTAGRPLDRVVDEFVRGLVADYRGGDGAVMRALTIEARQRPGGEFQRMTDDLDAHIRDALERLLRARSAEIAHPSPKRAARVGMLMLDATIREAVLFATDRGGPLGVRDAELRRELTRAYLAYL